MQFLAGLSICLAAAVNEYPIGGSAPVSDLMFGYVFVYFTGNGEGQESIFLAASEGNNALSWTELNEGQPILKSTKGTRGVRDPFLIRAAEGDKFYLIATNLHVAETGWANSTRHGSRYLEIWETPDLVSWYE
ncbi:hypothetical protein BFJ63_vAg17826 [Fusarium oxysporum f. sp. narcissi]|uniref:Uncharacterized protein n=1 Tax=Fusarium oxysporum f. sp. narcissi TaxID=451672 RepID=A0A4V1RXU2_FUSOX|nr:hypothetical protein BFJ63_vAg17826 [Fusarium oxysporum f. sp. narcissi]